MTDRSHKIQEAKHLRAKGLTYQEVGNQLGVSMRTAYRWLNPIAAEGDRKNSRAYKARNQKKIRAYNKLYAETHKNKCARCGGEMDRGCNSAICMSCRKAEVHARAELIVNWWAEGYKQGQIAKLLGWSRGHLSAEMDRLRAKGYHLPYRRRTGKKNATKFPEQKIPTLTTTETT